MTKSFTLHRSNGVRVSPCFQNVGVEGEEEKGLGQELPVGASDEETRPAVEAALPEWQPIGNDDGACLREKERGPRALAVAGRGESWVGGLGMK